MNIYISTPINGRKEPTMEEKRQAAKKRVEALSLLVSNLTQEEDRIISTFDLNEEGCSESEAMAKCVAAVIEADAIVMDSGWKSSKGCTVEFYTAKTYGKVIFYHELRGPKRRARLR